MDIKPNQVADYFLSLQDEDAGDLITHLKLQKLVYYAQAWYLVIYDKGIFEEDFEAWVHGPALRSLYSMFANLGWQPIPKDSIDTNFDSFDEDFKEFLNEVWEVYGQFSAKKLEELTHSESPWLDARKGYGPLERSSTPITKESMKNYYKDVLARDGSA